MLIPIRNRYHVVNNFNHSKFFKGLKRKPYRVQISAENGGKHFIRERQFVAHHKHSVVILFSGKNKKFEPNRNDAIRTRHTLNQQNLFIIKDICCDFNPLDFCHLITLLICIFRNQSHKLLILFFRNFVTLFLRLQADFKVFFNYMR